jgi:DNA-binding CsgD family transcriptional regulator
MQKTFHIELRSVDIPINETKIASKKDLKFFEWGQRNFYPYFINYLRQSAIHNALLNGKITIMQGLIPQIDPAIDQNGTASIKITELLELLIADYEQYNAFAILIRNDLISKTKVYEYVDVSNIRITEDNRIAYSEHWLDTQSDIIIFENYFLNPQAEESIAVYFEKSKSIYDIDKKKYIYQYYPEPSYSGAITAILTDIEIADFHYSEIINNFTAGTLISFNNGIPENKDEEQRIKNNLKETLTNRKKRGGIAVTFSVDSNSAPSIQTINGNNLDTRYLQLSEDVLQRILVGHNIPNPLLVGIKTPGQLGGATELEQARSIFEEYYINPRIKKFNRFISDILPVSLNLITANAKHSYHCNCNHIDIDVTEQVLKEFKARGYNKEQITIIEGINAEHTTDEKETLNRAQLLTDKPVLTWLQDRVLGMILGGEDLARIATILKIDSKTVYQTMQELQSLGLLTPKFKPTKIAKEILDNEDVIQVFYHYDVRPGLGDPIIPTTRKFCREMIEMDKYYTRAQIDEISRIVGRDVWYYRGGQFHDKRDGKTYPYCRHYWVQTVGKINKNLL